MLPPCSAWPSPDLRRQRLSAIVKECEGHSAEWWRDVPPNLGIAGKDLRRAIGGHPVSAAAHMAICAAFGMEPVCMFNGLSWPDASGTMFFVPPLSGPICWATLGAGVRVTRDLRGHSGRAAAEVAGVSVATVSRCENGRALSFDGLARLAAYVGQHPHAYTAPALLGRPGSTGNTHCNSLISQEAGHAD